MDVTHLPPCDLWAIDMEHGEPVLAHRIVSVHDPDTVIERRLTACGMTLTRHNHPSGWWQLPRGEPPLAEVKAIHCGLRATDIPTGGTA